MPIEIRELNIKIAVGQEGTTNPSSSSSTSAEGNQPDLVAICVEKVLEILKEKQER